MATKSAPRGTTVFTPVFVLDPYPFDVLVPEDLDDLAVPQKVDLLVLEGAVLHDLRCPELASSMDDGHFAPEAGEEERLLHRRVSASDDSDLLPPIERPVASRAGRDPAILELLLRFQTEPLGGGAGRDDERICEVGLLRGLDAERSPVENDLGRVGVHDPSRTARPVCERDPSSRDR
jgi:hypothetical protein